MCCYAVASVLCVCSNVVTMVSKCSKLFQCVEYGVASGRLILLYDDHHVLNGFNVLLEFCDVVARVLWIIAIVLNGE